MKTLKKLFSVSAIVALLGTLAPMYAFGAGNSLDLDSEFPAAYAYAYANGITTQSEDNADMGGKLTRIALAKMIAKYAINVLKLTPDTSKTCNFTDVTAALDAQYDNGVTQACQLGLMGVNITAFRPNDLVTRGEFGTTFSRALNANSDNLAAMNAADPYYKEHLNYLNKEGIMKVIDPNMLEVRGYVMLMMMRSDESYTAVEGCTAEELLACFNADDYDACIAACSDEEPENEPEEQEVKAGTITVKLGDSLDDGASIPQAGTIKLAGVKFTASSDDINIKTVVVKKAGLDDVPNGTKVWFEQDGVRISGRASFTSEGEATISFTPSYTVKANKTAEMDLYAEITAGTPGTNIQLKSVSFDTTAERVSGNFTTPKLTFATYTVQNVTFTPTNAGTEAVKASNEAIELGTFQLGTFTEARNSVLKSITLKQIGAADLENLSDFVLERNGEVVSNDYIIDGKKITFKVGDEISKDTASVSYTIKAVVMTVDTDKDTYQLSLNDTTDLNIVEAETEFRATITGKGNMTEYEISGGELKFARDTSVELSSTYPAGSEVVLMKGTITTKEAITFEDVDLVINTVSNGNMLSNYFTTLYLKIGDSLFTYTPENTDNAGDTIRFNGSATIEKSANVKLYGTLKNTAKGTVKFDAMAFAALKDLEYVSNGVPVKASAAMGNIEGVRVEIADTELNVTRIDGLGDTNVAAGSKNVTIYEAKLTSNQGNGVKVTKVAPTFTADASFNNKVTLRLYVNDSVVSERTYNAGVSFGTFNVTVNSSKDATIKIEADFNENVTEGKSFQIAGGALTYTDLLTSSTTTTPATKLPAGAAFTMRTAGVTVAATDSNPVATFMLAGSKDNKLVAFKVTAKNDSIKLYNVNFNATNERNASNYRLTDAEGNVIATASTIDTTNHIVAFTNISNAPSIAKDKSAIYYVIADANTNVNSSIQLDYTADGSNVKASNGNVVNMPDAYVTELRAVITATVDALADDLPAKDYTINGVAYTSTAASKGATGLTLTQKVGTTVAANSITVEKINAGLGSDATCTAATNTAGVTAVAHTTLAGKAHYIAENSIEVAKLDNPNKDLSTSALRFSITADGKDYSTLNSVDISLVTNYEGDSPKVKIYKNSVSTSNLLTAAAGVTITKNGVATTVALNANTTVDAGNTVNYIVVVEGLTMPTGTPDWTLKLTDVTFNTDKKVSVYTNLGDLPLSESK